MASRLWLLCVGLLLVGFADPTVERIEGAGRPAPDVTAARYPDVDVVVVEDEGRLTFLDPARPAAGYRFTERRRLKVMTPAGRDWADGVIAVGGGDTLESLAARSVGTDGNVTHMGRNDVVLEAQLQPYAQVFSDGTLVRYEVPGVDVGDVVEVEYTLRCTLAAALPRWRFDRPSVYTVRSSLRVEVPARWFVEGRLAKEEEVEVLEPESSRGEDGKTTFSWSLTDLPPPPLRPLGPPPELTSLRLGLVVLGSNGEGVGDWSALADEVRRLWGALPPLGPARRAAVRAQLGDASTAEVYRWVRDRIRYSGIFDGLGAVVPHAPDAVVDQGWGDCKDKAFLLAQLLDEVGVEAHVALVSPELRDLTKQAPHLGAFNHAVVALPDGEGFTFLDPTSSTLDFGEVPPSVAEHQVLVLIPGAARLLRVPPSERPSLAVTWVIYEGGAKVDVRLSGASAMAARHLLDASPDRLEDAVAEYFAEPERRGIRAPRVSTDADGTITLGADFRPDGLFVEVGRTRLLRLGELLIAPTSTGGPVGRDQPLWLGTPSRRVERIVYLLPPGTEVRAAPAPRRWADAGLALDMSVEQTDGRVTVTRRVDISVERLPPDQRAAYRHLLDLVFATSSEALQLTSADPLGEVAP